MSRTPLIETDQRIYFKQIISFTFSLHLFRISSLLHGVFETCVEILLIFLGCDHAVFEHLVEVARHLLLLIVHHKLRTLYLRQPLVEYPGSTEISFKYFTDFKKFGILSVHVNRTYVVWK